MIWVLIKKDILSAELETCKELLIDTTNDTERKWSGLR